MDNSPTFSVIIATYRRRAYVLEAVRSVLEQSHPPHEVIVVIDGDGDGTAEALRQYDSVVVVEQPNRGRAVASNTGVARASGEWVCFLDDDDLWHRDKLQVTAAYLAEHPGCQALRNPVWFFAESDDGPQGGFGFQRDFIARTLDECHAAVANGDPSTNPFDYLDIEGRSFELMLERNRGVMSSTVVRRETLIRAGALWPMNGYSDDWTMFVNVARFCEWHMVPRRLGFTRLHNGQSSADTVNALFILGAQIGAWYSGRPLPERTAGLDFINTLSGYGCVYRRAIQGYFWSAVQGRQLSAALAIRRAGRLLLPRWRDWLYIHLPPQLTWRWERYVLGRYR